METATSSRSPSPSTYRPLVILAARLAPAVALGLGPVIASTLLGAAALFLTSSAASAAMERMSVASDGQPGGVVQHGIVDLVRWPLRRLRERRQ
jgi:hypothetical protein